jgi:hypothetical protein
VKDQRKQMAHQVSQQWCVLPLVLVACCEEIGIDVVLGAKLNKIF